MSSLDSHHQARRWSGQRASTPCPPRWLAAAVLVMLVGRAAGDELLMKHSDVPIMSFASPQVWRTYGVTIIAWGGGVTASRLEQARQAGVRCFASVGMVTEFARYYERFPETYEEGLCRDVRGNPIKVPWLTDHQHKGIPYWWCCTNQPQFRQYLLERVEETVRAGADGIHIDDHLGTAGCIRLGGCFCDRCVEGFRRYLTSLGARARRDLGVKDLAGFDYRKRIQAWLADHPADRSKPWRWPLWKQWETYHLTAAAAFMAQLKRKAAQVAGHYVPMSANAGLLWYPHLVDYQTLDMFVCEVSHEASTKTLSPLPLFAYRIAEALGRPLCATAGGWDWAFVNENGLEGLVRAWIAQAYACGQFFMAPHHQWCYTREKGTHWYDAPAEAYAPLYRFVRDSPELFDDYQTLAQVGLLYSYAAVRRSRDAVLQACTRLAEANISFRLLIAGDELLDHPLAASELRAVPKIIVVQPVELQARDAALLEDARARGKVIDGVEAALRQVEPAVRVWGAAHVWALPRLAPGKPPVIHLLNRAYDFAADAVRPARNVRLAIVPGALDIKAVRRCTLFAPGQPPRELLPQSGIVTIPELNLWAVLRIDQ